MRIAPFFSRIDWIAFGATTVSALAVYFFTLTPEIGLRNDGVSATSAAYGGVSMPAGFPVWTLWAWAFAKLPFCSLGWRAALGSSLAGAMACGVIGMLVSRGGAELATKMPWAEIVRASAGVSAGLAFGLNGALWRQAVIPDPWPMTMLLLCLVLCQLIRWSAQPERRGRLFVASLLYGLALTNSQILWSVAPAIPFFVAVFDLGLARDIFLTETIFYLLGLCGAYPGLWQSMAACRELAAFHLVGGSAAISGIALTLITRRLYTEWGAVMLCAALLCIGQLAYFYLPIASMTNPPINWGYPRTPEGFFHVITRGQYDRLAMTSDLKTFIGQIWQYILCAGADFGWPCLAVCAIPFVRWRQLSLLARKWMVALLFLYFFLTFLMLAVLDPTRELTAQNLVKMYFSASYIVLAIWMGYGLVLFSRWTLGGSLTACNQEQQQT